MFTRNHRKLIATLSACAALLGTVASASAHVVGVVDDAIIVPAPSTVEPGGAMQSIEFFNEKQDVILPYDLVVDLVPGDYETLPDMACSQVVIPGGTCVRSHYGYLQNPTTLFLEGGARFNREILGVMVTQGGLDATNFLGAGATTYPSGAVCGSGSPIFSCGLDMASNDRLSIASQTVTLDLEASVPGDRVRVITVGNAASCQSLN